MTKHMNKLRETIHFKDTFGYELPKLYNEKTGDDIEYSYTINKNEDDFENYLIEKLQKEEIAKTTQQLTTEELLLITDDSEGNGFFWYDEYNLWIRF